MKKATSVAAALLVVLGVSAGTASAIDINGGSSWSGWDTRGNSLDVGIWGAGSTTRSYDLYTSVFTSDGNMSSSGGTQVKAGSAPSGFSAGAFSQGAFADGHTILGIGLDMNDPARAVGMSFITFGLGLSSFQAASSLGGSDGRVDDNKWSNAGDFSVWMDGGVNGLGPANLGVLRNGGTEKGGSGWANAGQLPGGVGSGVSYDFAFRQFHSDDRGGAVQYFFDLTAMQDLYGANQPANIAGKWSAGGGQNGTIEDLITFSLYNSDPNYGNANQTVFSVQIPRAASVPDGGATLVLLGGVLTGLAAMLRRQRA